MGDKFYNHCQCLRYENRNAGKNKIKKTLLFTLIYIGKNTIFFLEVNYPIDTMVIKLQYNYLKYLK